MNNQESKEIDFIMQLARKIFENAGIKRKIDNVQKFQSDVIYFQIAKIIFPEIMGQLIELSQNKLIASAQKIQGLVNIIQQIVEVNLDHIEGAQIAMGNKKHIKHFMELLYALSQKMFNQNQQSDQEYQGQQDEQEQHEIDENDNQQKHYDEKQHLDKSNDNIRQKQLIVADYPLKRQINGNAQTNSKTQKQKIGSTQQKILNEEKSSPQMARSQSQSSAYLIPPLNNYPDSKRTQKKIQLIQPKKNKIKKVKFHLKEKNLPFKNMRNFLSQKNWIYPINKQKKRIPQAEMKITFMKNCFSVIEDLEQNKLINQTKQFKKWADKQNRNQNELIQNINSQFAERQTLVKMNLQERSKMIKDSIQNSQEYVRAMKNLFKEQKNIVKNIKKNKEQKDMKAINNLISTFKKKEKMFQNQILQSLSQKKQKYQSKIKKIRV